MKNKGMIESSGVVRRIVEEDGASFVSFTSHDGYFELPKGDKAARRKAIESRDLNKEIRFAFNAQAKILFIKDVPASGAKSPAGSAAPTPGKG